jgi:peptidoglycan/LPS O-acetylase OafA/YrhL
MLYHCAGVIEPEVRGRVGQLVLAPFREGWCGVDLFFVLSGFLIGGMLLDQKGAANYFWAFYARRFFRIVPLYAAFIGLAVLACRVLGWPTVPAWYFSLFLQNIWMTAHGSPGINFLGPTWSLAIEEQFYLTLPALVFFLDGRRFIRAVVAGIAIAPIARLVVVAAIRNHPYAVAYVLLPCRMDSLLIGVAAAHFIRRPGAIAAIRAARSRIWTAIEVLTVLATLVLFRPEGPNPVTTFAMFDVLALLFAFILLASLVDEKLSRLLRAKWIVFLGTIAYGLYLLHPLALALASRFAPPSVIGNVAAIAAALAATIWGARLSWQWFEKPLIAIGKKANYGPSHEQTTEIALILANERLNARIE